MVEYPQTFISISKTASDDNKFNLTGLSDMWFSEINIHITTHNAKYGDYSGQTAVINANDIVSFTNVNLKDIFFINSSAGSNTVVTAVGSLMMRGQRKALLGRE